MDGRIATGLGLVITGLILAGAGLIVIYADRIPFLGKLPGDIHLSGKGWSFNFPVVTCIFLSLLVTIVINIISRR
ncbi:DUF2905 domain-containing protein [Candidatus Latescibacterota bacterium]